MNLCEYAKQLWELYMFGENPEEVWELLNAMDDNISIIGTGQHEFYEELSAFSEALGKEGPERKAIDFTIRSVWAKEQPVTDDVKLVYGGLHVTGTGTQTDVSVDMDTRYSMVFHRAGETWKLVHIHQSLPYIDQKEGEYYPKTLLDQVEEEKKRADYMAWLAAMDQMTGLFNHSAFYEESERELKEHGGGFCMTIDLDDFKQINDSYGHLTGDAVLHEMGKILRNAAGDRCVTGRIGGDEFAVFSGKITSADEALSMADGILAQAKTRARDSIAVFPGISIGISQVRQGEALKEAFRRADEMLYEVKRAGKRGYRYCE